MYSICIVCQISARTPNPFVFILYIVALYDALTKKCFRATFVNSSKKENDHQHNITNIDLHARSHVRL